MKWQKSVFFSYVKQWKSRSCIIIRIFHTISIVSSFSSFFYLNVFVLFEIEQNWERISLRISREEPFAIIDR